MNEPTDHNEAIERYLNGEMSPGESQAFEKQINSDARLADAFDFHKELHNALKAYGEREALRRQFNDFHREINAAETPPITTLKPEKPHREKSKSEHGPETVTLGQLYRTAAVAACLAVVLSVSAVFFLQSIQAGEKQAEPVNYMENPLPEAMEPTPERSDDRTEAEGTPETAPPSPRASATAFAIARNGYLVTAAHFVKNRHYFHVKIEPDSVAPYRAKVVKTDARLDLALLQIVDERFEKFRRLPYPFKSGEARLGESVYTLGFPGEEMVYGEGSISALSGFKDTVEYQVSVPLNPGNSGSPLLNERGEIVGVITGKHSSIDGASYATKSGYMLEFVNTYADSLKDVKLTFSARNALKRRKRPDQIVRLQPFVFEILAK